MDKLYALAFSEGCWYPYFYVEVLAKVARITWNRVFSSSSLRSTFISTYKTIKFQIIFIWISLTYAVTGFHICVYSYKIRTQPYTYICNNNMESFKINKILLERRAPSSSSRRRDVYIGFSHRTWPKVKCHHMKHICVCLFSK